MDDVFGRDIRLDESDQAPVAANGELLLTEGAQTGVQDIRLRLFQPLGELFYDTTFGSLVHEWFCEENTPANRLAFIAEVERRVAADPRVAVGSAACELLRWGEMGLQARVSWEFVGEDHPFNLVIETSTDKLGMVIADVHP